MIKVSTSHVHNDLSKVLLGVIRQIPLHVQFRVTLFDNFNDISTFTTTHYLR